MNPQRITGIVLLMLGMLVMIIGLNGSGSAASWYVLGGVVVGLAGLFLTIVSGRIRFTM